MSSTLDSLIDSIRPYDKAPEQLVDHFAGNEKIERPFAAPAAA